MASFANQYLMKVAAALTEISKSIKGAMTRALKLVIFVSFLMTQLSLCEIASYRADWDSGLQNFALAETSDPWYDAAWLYRKQIDITGGDADLTGYQVEFIVDYEPGKMKADFSDLRFTNADSSVLCDHYVEAKTDSVLATVWVKVDSIPAAGTHIFMYYGNAAASSFSSREDTLDVWTQTTSEDFRAGVATDSLVRSGELDLDIDVDWTGQSAWTPTVYSYIAPDFADLDSDGDMDAILGERYGGNLAYKNIGNSVSPVWERIEIWDAPDAGDNSVPSFVDLDADGDQDLVVGEKSGRNLAYKNTGGVNAPVWSREAAWDVPDVGDYSLLNFADLDGDGDSDAFAGNYIGTGIAYKNTGGVDAPVWTREFAWDLGDTGTYTNPSFADVDDDGDFDLFVLEAAYENTGNAGAPVWTRNAALDIPNVGYGEDPVFFDLDGDGDLDAVTGERYGGTYAYKNTGSVSVPTWTREASWDILDTGYDLDPAFADLDDDGDSDLLMGNVDGVCLGYRNAGTDLAPVWTKEEAWDMFDVGSFASPAFADLDDDGDFDLLIGENSGIIYGFKNIGSMVNPAWSAETSWNTPDTGRSSAPDFADLDNDGDLDFLTGDYNGFSYGYKNAGNATNPVWQKYSAWDLPDNVGGEAAVAMSDLDGDGDLDAIASSSNGDKDAYRNIGTVAAPVWQRMIGWDAPGGTYNPSGDFVDLDGDGLEDLFVGSQYAERNAYKMSFSYLASGTFVSSSFDTTSLMNLQSLSFDAATPADTAIKFQLAANNDNMTWNFIGPDGTAATYYDADGELTDESLDHNRYMKYKAYLETTDAVATPALGAMAIYYAKSTETEPVVTVADAAQFMDHLDVTGNGSQLAGTAQTLTITAKDSLGNLFSSYAGDKFITFTGAGSSGSSVPAFIDKNGSGIAFGESGVLTFTNGSATVVVTLYRAETADIEVTDGTYASSVPLRVRVGGTGSSFILPERLDISGTSIVDTGGGILALMDVPDAVIHMAISATPDFLDASWENISDKDRLLSEYMGNSLYIKFRTGRGVVSDVLRYDPRSAASQTLQEGDIVKTTDSCDVYIIKYKNGKRYKRLILSPNVFASYGHLKRGNIKVISRAESDKYVTSNLVKETLDAIIYLLFPNGDAGERKVLDTNTPYDADSVYEINATDRDSYSPVR